MGRRKNKSQKKKKWHDFEDDGRVIAPMDVDGMPWTQPKRSNYVKNAANRIFGEDESLAQQRQAFQQQQFTKAELRQFKRSAVLAGLSVVAVIGGFLILIIVLMVLFL